MRNPAHTHHRRRQQQQQGQQLTLGQPSATGAEFANVRSSFLSAQTLTSVTFALLELSLPFCVSLVSLISLVALFASRARATTCAAAAATMSSPCPAMLCEPSEEVITGPDIFDSASRLWVNSGVLSLRKHGARTSGCDVNVIPG